MKSVLKIAGSIVAVAVGLFLAVLVAVAVIVDPNEYRPYLVDAVEGITGRALEIEGDLGLELLPCCNVSLGSSRLGSPPGFPDPEFASLEAASLSLKIWPLLVHQQIQVGTVTLQGLHLNLVRSTDGRVNWEFDGESAKVTDDAPPVAEQATSIEGVGVEGIVVRDGRIRYRDLETGQDYSVRGLDIDSRLRITGDRVAVADSSLAAIVAGADIPGGEASVRVASGSVLATLADDVTVTLETLDLEVGVLDTRLLASVSGGMQAGEQDLQGEFQIEETAVRALLGALAQDAYAPADDRALARLAASARWTLRGNALAVDDLVVVLDESTLRGSVGVDDLDRAGLRFDLVLDRVDVDRYATAAAGTVPEAAADPGVVPLARLADVDVDGRLRIASLRASGVDLEEVALQLKAHEGAVSAALSGRGLSGIFRLDGQGEVRSADPALGGTVTVENVSPRALLSALDAQAHTSNPGMLARFGGTARWRLTPTAVSLEDMRWQLDDTTVTGSARVSDFDTAAARFDLTLDRLNVDHYLPPDDTSAKTDEDAEIIPMDVIRDLNLNGTLRARELVMLDMRLGNVLAEVAAADGVLRLDPLTAALYGGSYRGSITIDATGAKPKLELDQEIAAVQVSEVLKTFFDSDLLTGSLSFEMTGGGTGNTTADLLRGLAADVSLDLSDGVYRGVNVDYEVQRARALFKKEPAPVAPDKRETAIRALAARGRMSDGVLQTNQLSAETDALQLLGEGGINLVDLVLDYELNAQVRNDASGTANLQDLARYTIPLTIGGSVSSPKVGVDLGGLITSAARETVQRKARDLLLRKLGGAAAAGDAQPAAGVQADGPEPSGSLAPTASAEAAESASEQPATDAAAEQPSAQDLLRRGLRELLKPREDPPSG